MTESASITSSHLLCFLCFLLFKFLPMNPISRGLSAEVARRLELALAAGKEAGRLTLRYFQQDNFQVERKSDASPVTIADRSAEQLLRDRIGAAFPVDGILGEELGTTKGTSGFNWILDPI